MMTAYAGLGEAFMPYHFPCLEVLPETGSVEQNRCERIPTACSLQP